MSVPELIPNKTWDLDDKESPSDFLIGHLEGRWVGEQQSIEDATIALISATFVKAGLPTDDAIDKAYEYTKKGVALAWNSSTLTFDFKKEN